MAPGSWRGNSNLARRCNIASSAHKTRSRRLRTAPSWRHKSDADAFDFTSTLWRLIEKPKARLLLSIGKTFFQTASSRVRHSFARLYPNFYSWFYSSFRSIWFIWLLLVVCVTTQQLNQTRNLSIQSNLMR